MGWQGLSSLWNGATTPQKQLFTGFNSSLDRQRMMFKTSAHARSPFISVGTEHLNTSLRSIHLCVCNPICNQRCWELAHRRPQDTEALMQLSKTKPDFPWRGSILPGIQVQEPCELDKQQIGLKRHYVQKAQLTVPKPPKGSHIKLLFTWVNITFSSTRGHLGAQWLWFVSWQNYLATTIMKQAFQKNFIPRYP